MRGFLFSRTHNQSKIIKSESTMSKARITSTRLPLSSLSLYYFFFFIIHTFFSYSAPDSLPTSFRLSLSLPIHRRKNDCTTCCRALFMSFYSENLCTRIHTRENNIIPFNIQKKIFILYSEKEENVAALKPNNFNVFCFSVFGE